MSLSSVGKTRLTRVVAAAVAGGLMLTVSACAGGGGGGGEAGSATKGEVNWWGFTPDLGVGEDYIALFNEEYPDIKVNYKFVPISQYDAALRPALASSSGPDVYNVAPGGGIASVTAFGGSAIDMTPVLEDALGDDFADKIAENGVTGLTTKDGKLAGLPVGSTFGGTVWINQDIFDKYSLTAPTTLDEWVKVCDTLRSNGVQCLAQGAGQVAFNQDTLQSISDSIEPGMWSKASKGEVEWSDPVFVEALEIWKKMFDDEIMVPGALGLQQYPDANNLFQSQQAAMVMMGTWYMQYSTVAGMTAAISAAGVGSPVPFTAVSIPFPDVSGNGNEASLYGDPDYGLAVNSRSKVTAAATTFATWLTTTTTGQQAVANALNTIPSLKGVEPDWDTVELVNPDVQRPSLQALIAQTSSITEPRLSLVSADLQQAVGVASTTVAAGDATPEEAAKTLQETMKRLG